MKIGFVLFPQVTQLDFTGSLQVLHRLPGAETLIIAETPDPVPSDCGLGLVPTHTLDAAPDLDMICVPGGFGVAPSLSNTALIDFIRAQGSRADYVTSVCTGAFLLGRAGLLEGKNATTHWAYTHLLDKVGATYVPQRVVRDGNRFTGGGVTAGIDFALTIAAEISGESVACSIQLAIEYDPDPPFRSGHPDVAGPDHVARMKSAIYDRNADVMAAALAA